MVNWENIFWIINWHSKSIKSYKVHAVIDRWVGRCNTFNDLSNEVRVPNKTEDLNQSVFNMVAGINEYKTLTKYSECKYKLEGRKCNSDQWWNNNKCWCECNRKQKTENIYQIWFSDHVWWNYWVIRWRNRFYWKEKRKTSAFYLHFYWLL